MTIRTTMTALAWGLAAAFATAPASAQDSDPGAYLAGRQAALDQSYGRAIQYFTRALNAHPNDPAILENLLAALLAQGQLAGALPVADHMVAKDIASQPAYLARLVHRTQKGDWDGVIALMDAGHGVGPLMDGLALAWADFGRGDMRGALDGFDAVIGQNGLRSAGLYHKSMALALAGDAESAEAILALPPEQGLQLTRDAALARAQLLSQLDRHGEALVLMDDIFGPVLPPHLETMRSALAAGETLPFDILQSPADGIASACLTLAGVFYGEDQNGLALLYARMAQALRPSHEDTLLLTADLLSRVGRPDLAAHTYEQIPQGAPSRVQAELGRAQALAAEGDAEAAIAALQALSESAPDDPVVWATLGDHQRRSEQAAEAEAAYTRALDLIPGPAPDRWLVHYTRAMARDMLEDWPGTEADLRAALALRPEQPQVLNYLGYSLVERRESLPEALEMIERAVAAEPENGAIVDSLAWVLFRLGRYDQAIVHMERAAELEPTDPILSDHLGDVLWAVGRFEEARFQWKRALSFAPEPDLRARILRKQELGLDRVLIEEDSPPIWPVHD